MQPAAGGLVSDSDGGGIFVGNAFIGTAAVARQLVFTSSGIEIFLFLLAWALSE